MHIWTSSPNEEIWRQLRYFTSPANVENLLLGKIASGRKVPWAASDTSRAAREISACVRQADEYFRAASNVGLATKPLLLFYGAESLAKAGLLANEAALELRSLKYHGLNTRSATADNALKATLQAYIDNPSLWTLEDEFAVSHAGVFAHLCRVFGGITIRQGIIFRFKELVRVSPDLSAIFARHYGEFSHCVCLYDGPSVADDDRLYVYFSMPSHGEITSIFPEFLVGFEPVFQHQNFPGFKKADGGELGFAVVQAGTIAGRYLVRPLRSGVHDSAPVLFAAMFILSNLVRYKPAFWMDVIEGRSSGSVSVAESLCDVFERRFPNDILDSMWHESFTFGAPGYIT
jgi:hypothetical protein